MPSFSIETSGFDAARQILSPALYDSALVSALNADIDKTKTKANFEIRQVYNVKARAVRQAMRVVRARKGSTETVLFTQGDRIELKEFSPGVVMFGKRRGVSVIIKHKAGRKPVKGGFVVARQNNNIFTRKGRARYPIVKKYGPSIPQMIRVADVWDELIMFAQQEFPRLFAGQLRRRIDKINAKKLAQDR